MTRRRLLTAALLLTAATVGVAAWAGASAQGPVAALLAGGLAAACVLGWIALVHAAPSDDHAVALREALLEERRFADRLRSHLDASQQAQHELASTTMAAELGLDALRQLAEADRLDGARARALLDEADTSLRRACETIAQVRLHRMQLWPQARVAVGPALEAALAQVEAAFPAVQLRGEVTPEADRPIAVAGGREGFVAALRELLVNASEGDGRRGASAVTARATIDPVGALVVVTIDDDGPGVPEKPLPLVSTKADRAGLGIFRCERFARESGGALTITRTARGTRARLELPVLVRADTERADGGDGADGADGADGSSRN